MTGPSITFWKLDRFDGFRTLRPYVLVYDDMVEIHSPGTASG